jgi:hypothetical protein
LNNDMVRMIQQARLISDNLIFCLFRTAIVSRSLKFTS